MDIILASASPRRSEILRQVGIHCRVVPSAATEIHVGKPRMLAETNAGLKAEPVARQNMDSLIIAADTVVVVDDRVLGKPRDQKDTERMLYLLSGRWHEVITGVALMRGHQRHIFSVGTDVKFRSLSAKDVQEYAATGEPLDKAGAYGIQGIGGAFVEGVKGCYYNVVGLPLPRLIEELEQHFSFCLWRHRTQSRSGNPLDD